MSTHGTTKKNLCFHAKEYIVAAAASIPLALIVAASITMANGFFYTFDDPYIHLQLAENIGTKFHYGLNSTELSAPSSSILWPFILSLGVLSGPIFELIPIIINSSLLCLVSIQIFKWLSDDLQLDPIASFGLTITIIFSTGLYWLCMTGMEHMLSVALVTYASISLIKNNDQHFAFYLSLAMLLLVRYDNLAIVAPIILYKIILFPEQRRITIIWALIILAPIGIFSIFLNKLGLPLLPTSIISKTIYTQGSLSALLNNFHINATRSISLFIIIISSSLYNYKNTNKINPLIIISLLSLILHCIFGRIEQARYYNHIYMLCLINILWTCRQSKPSFLAKKNRSELLFIGAIIILSCSKLFLVNFLTPLASKNIRDQQAQIAIIAKYYLDQPIAVNDIGQVSFRNKHYTLDLAGLASPEALTLRKNNQINSKWVASLMSKHKIHYAFIYDSWFPNIPSNFIKVAELHLPGMKITPSSNTVSFYADNTYNAETLKESLIRYAKDRPNDAAMLALMNKR